MEKLTFSLVYPQYGMKVEKKRRTKEELQQVKEWLTGFDDKKNTGSDSRKSDF